MTTGRTSINWARVYIDGRDQSGYTRSFGPLVQTFDEGTDDAINLRVKQTLMGNATIGMGTLNGIFDNTATSGIHVLMNGAGVSRNVLIAQGIQAEPAIGDPAFMGQFLQSGYSTGPDDNPITASIPFANSASGATALNYAEPWGTLMHALTARTAANTAVGLDQTAGTTKGGYMMYHVTAAGGAGNMTCAFKVQHSTTTNLDGSFGDLITSGNVNCVGGGVSGVVALAKTATVGRYVRWNITLGTATSVTFSLGFVRGNI